MSNSRILSIVVLLLTVITAAPNKSYGQAFGVSLQGNMMPAAGGMGGAGIARPQDLQSTLALNPATLAQKHGTQFSFSGSWTEPTINLNQQAPALGGLIQPFDAKSQRPGSIVGNIAATQDYSAKGIPVTIGMGLLTASGLGINYREALRATERRRSWLCWQRLSVAAQLTDRLSLGFAMIVSTANIDGVFSGVSAATPSYNLRGSLGFTYDVGMATTVGGFWHTQEKHTFKDFIRFGLPGTAFQDVTLEFPNVWGLGLANEALCGGKLLVAVDFSFFEWSQAAFFGSIWDDQLAVQTGLQYTTDRGCKLRLGYAWGENASRNVVAPTIGGIMPQAGVDYIQALFPNINENRITAGFGKKDLLPGMDLDVFVGGMFDTTQDYGDTRVSVAGYWVGFGTTWRFGRGGCNQCSVPSIW